MSKISKYDNTVLKILENVPETRGDDKLLFYYVLLEEGIEPDVLSLSDYLKSKTVGTTYFPNYESITRVRRKLQESRPYLNPPRKVKMIRGDAEEDFIEYARSHV